MGLIKTGRFRDASPRRALTERFTRRAQPYNARGFIQGITGRRAGRRMSVIIGVRGRSAVGDVNVATTRWRRLERPLSPRTLVYALAMILLIMVLVTAFLMKLLTMFRLPDGRMREGRRRVSQYARLQAQDRPLTDPARRTVLRIPRVITASRRPGAKRVPGRGVVHDEPHIALNARPSTPSHRRHVARGTFSSSCVRLHRRRHVCHAGRSDGRRRGARTQRHSDAASRVARHRRESADRVHIVRIVMIRRLGPRWRSIVDVAQKVRPFHSKHCFFSPTCKR